MGKADLKLMGSGTASKERQSENSASNAQVRNGSLKNREAESYGAQKGPNPLGSTSEDRGGIQVKVGDKISEWSPAAISAINGMQGLEEGLKTNFNVIPPAANAMFDAGARRRVLWFKILFFVLLFAGLVWSRQVDWVQSNVWLPVQFYLDANILDNLRQYGQPSIEQNEKIVKKQPLQIKKSKLKRIETTVKESVEMVPEDAQNRAQTLMKIPRRTALPGCRKVVDQYINGNQVLGVGAALDTAECYMLMQDYQGSLRILAGYEAVLRLVPESKFTAVADFQGASDLLYALVESSVYSGNQRLAQEILRGRCPRWQANLSTCIAKLFVYGVQKIPVGKDAATLFETSGGIGRSSQARIWFAGAMIASHEGRAKVADQRLKLAMASIPARSLHLRRQILDYGMTSLFHRGAMIQLKSFAAQAGQELKSSDHGNLLKLRFLRDISASSDKKTTMKNYLLMGETLTSATKDLELLDILGVESLRQGLLDIWAVFLEKLRTAVEKKRNGEPESIERNVGLWMVRTYLAQGRYMEAIKALGEFKGDLGNSHLSSHLRGVGFFLMAENSNTQLQAIAELSKAYRLKRNWESLVVLGFALAKTGKADRVAGVLKDLNQMVTTPGQKYWVDLLKGEYYLGQGKLTNARKSANDLLYAEPRAILPRLLLIRILSQTKDIVELKKQQDELGELTRKNPYPSSFEGLASPFGPLALARRPID